MIFKTDNTKTWLEDEAGDVLAVLEHPVLRSGVVNIKHTYIDESLRGQGIAGKMMKVVAERLKKGELQAELSCSYAIRWFADHPEYDDIVVNPGGI